MGLLPMFYALNFTYILSETYAEMGAASPDRLLEDHHHLMMYISLIDLSELHNSDFCHVFYITFVILYRQ